MESDTDIMQKLTGTSFNIEMMCFEIIMKFLLILKLYIA